MVTYYAVVYYFDQPYIDDPELFLVYKLFDFVGSFYTSYDHPTLTLVQAGEGVIALAVYALIPTIEETPPRLGFPFRTPTHPVKDIRDIQYTFEQYCSTRPTALPRLRDVLHRTTVIGTSYSTRKPSLPNNLPFN